MKIWQAVVIGIVIGFLGGVGTVQMTMAADVRDNKVNIAHLKKEHEDTKAAMLKANEDARVVFEKRMDNVVRLWEANLEQQRANSMQQAELINLVKQVIISGKKIGPG